MCCFRNVDELKDVWDTIIETISKDPILGAKLHRINISQQLEFTDVKQLLNISASKIGYDEKAGYLTWNWEEGISKEKLSVIVSFDSSIGNEYFQGKISVMNALITGKVRIKGKKKMAMEVFNVMASFSPRYIKLLKIKGYDHLIIK